MWVSFFLAMATAIVFVMIPGVVFFKGLRFSWCSSVCVAPIYSIALFAVVSIVLGVVNAECTWWLVLALSMAISLLALLASVLANASFFGKPQEGKLAKEWRKALLGGFRFREAVAYCIVALVLVGGVFIWSLDGADSYPQTIDSIFHLNTAKAFVDSGFWSSLGASPYVGSESSVQPFEVSGFYPAAWHCLVAMVSSASGSTVSVCSNAVNAVLVGVVFPCGAYFFMRVLFAGSRNAVLWGALTCVGFAAFPWRFLYWGVLFPNLLAYCMVLPVAALFILAVEARGDRNARMKYIGAFILGLAALVFSQTNSVFTVAVMMIPYCVRAISDSLSQRDDLRRWHARKWVAIACFLVFVVLVWGICFKLPFLQDVVTNTWAAIYGLPQAIVNVVLLSYCETPVQLVLAIFVIIGLAAAIRKRRYRWLAAAYLIMALMYLLNVSFDGTLKQIIAGFWYTDHNRIAANLALISMPLAALGLQGAASAVTTIAKDRLSTTTSDRPKYEAAVNAIVAIVTAIAMFYPNYSIVGWIDVTTAFGYTRDRIVSAYSASLPNVYGPSEKDFVGRVLETVPVGARIANNPNDGSAFSYGTQGANILYRSFFGYAEDGENDDCALIREKLCDIAYDENVRTAVENVGIEYVLQLDFGDGDLTRKSLSEIDPSAWAGIDGVSESTDGFELVLSEGDMRLYKITAV